MILLGRIFRVLGLLAVVAIVGFAIYIASRQNLKFDVPLPDVSASADSAVVERGRYIVRNVAMCGACHGDPARMGAEGSDAPLSGGFEWNIPPGKFRAPNLTPDPETGIGSSPDGAIARALRNGVGADGRALLPFMEMQGLSDDDLTAVVSYLRTQPPVVNDVPAHEYSLLGRIVRGTVLSQPVGPKESPPQIAPRGPTVEAGRYLAGSVANCWACHTERDERTGELTNDLYSGAREFHDPLDPDRIWAPPNITTAPKSGVLARMSEDEFVARFRAGRILPGSPMPWAAYGRMREDDVRAIYRFLKTVPPVENDVGPAFRPARP